MNTCNNAGVKKFRYPVYIWEIRIHVHSIIAHSRG